jgi:hypothetical protein
MFGPDDNLFSFLTQQPVGLDGVSGGNVLQALAQAPQAVAPAPPPPPRPRKLPRPQSRRSAVVRCSTLSGAFRTSLRRLAAPTRSINRRSMHAKTAS